MIMFNADYMPYAFLNNISKKAIVLYFISLLTCSLLFNNYVLDFQWMVWGTIEVLFFFYLNQKKYSQFQNVSSSTFIKKVFFIALITRVCYVIFSYIYYDTMTGSPFEYDSMDAYMYDKKAKWLESVVITHNYKEWNAFVAEGLSDVGYVVYLSFIYFLFDDSILVARIIKAILSGFTCVFAYKLTARNFGENIARVASLMCVFSPNLIFYCGLHLKEPEMVFLTVLFVERADYALRQSKLNVVSIIMILFIAVLTFSFRTVLGMTLFCSFGLAVLFSSNKVINKSKKIVISFFSIVFISISILNNNAIMNEVSEIINTSADEQIENMEWRSRRSNGNKFAKYAGAAVFAPLIFSIPFPTMVETPNQYQQKMLNGGNFCKNILSIFTIIAIFFVFSNKLWKKHILIISFFIGYLIILIFSKYAQSERFHQPVLPLTYIFASYGLFYYKSFKIKKIFQVWLFFIFGVIVFWNWFKLAGRDLI